MIHTYLKFPINFLHASSDSSRELPIKTMPSAGTTKQLKVDAIVDGIRILKGTSLLLNEFFSALKERFVEIAIKNATSSHGHSHCRENFG